MWGGKDTALPIQNLGVKRGLNGQRHAPGALSPRKWSGRARLKRDGTRAEARFGLTAKRTSPFKLAGGGLVQSTTGSRGVRISSSNGSNAGYTMF